MAFKATHNQMGDVIRYYYSGKTEVLMEDVHAATAEEFLNGPDAKSGSTFDDFVARRWARAYESR